MKFYVGEYVSSKYNPECVYKVLKINENNVDVQPVVIHGQIAERVMIHAGCNPENLYRVALKVQIVKL